MCPIIIKKNVVCFGTGKSKIKLTKDAGFSSTSDSSGEHLLSPTHPAPSQNDVESESTYSIRLRNCSNMYRSNRRM